MVLCNVAGMGKLDKMSWQLLDLDLVTHDGAEFGVGVSRLRATSAQLDTVFGQDEQCPLTAERA